MALFDENEQVLLALKEKGRNLGPPRPVDFSYLFTDESAALMFASDARRAGFQVQITDTASDPEKDDLNWDLTASRTMEPTCENITSAEEQLNALARLYNGQPDGWGFFDV